MWVGLEDKKGLIVANRSTFIRTDKRTEKRTDMDRSTRLVVLIN